MRVAVIQSDRQRLNKGKNLSQTLETLDKIDAVDIACLSEVWMGAVIPTEKETRFLLDDLSSVAKEKQFMLLTGGLLEKRGGKIFDVCHIIDKNKGVIGEQQKLFPSVAVGERQFMEGGSTLTIFPCAGVCCGVLVCVDLMYAELARTLALSGAEVIFNPANIPEERTLLWHGLVRTRAAENTVFVAYVNNTHTRYFDGRPVMGRSLIAGPSGDTIVAAEDAGKTLFADLDLSLMTKQRQRWPYLQDVSKMREKESSLFPVQIITVQHLP